MPLSRRYSPEMAPGDSTAFGFDFSTVIPPGVGIASGRLLVYLNQPTPAPATDLGAGPVNIEGRVLWAVLTGGSNGTDYQLRWTATDSDGYTWTRTGLILCAQTS